MRGRNASLFLCKRALYTYVCNYIIHIKQEKYKKREKYTCILHRYVYNISIDTKQISRPGLTAEAAALAEEGKRKRRKK